jgi:hypothetical protein
MEFSMSFSIKPKLGLGVVFFFSLFLSISVLADNLLITRSFSGIWDQPQQQNQGFVLHIGENPDDVKVGVAYWYTYGENQPTWLVGIGDVNGNEINMKLYTVSGLSFMAEAMADSADVDEVGTLDLKFRNCNQGQAYYDTPEEIIGAGEFPIKRLNSIYRMRCSGGISDDTKAGGKPLQLEVDLDGDSGAGKAKFWEREDRSDFKVEVEGLADKTYTLRVCGTPQDGDLVVTDGEGELAYRSPENDGQLLLTFDPRDCLIEVLDGDTVILTSGEDFLAEKTMGKPDKNDKEGTKVEIDLDSTEVIEGAEGEAEYEDYADEKEFEVEIENVPAGSYTLRVGGDEKGSIEVVEDDGDFEGKIKFTNPQSADTLELNFDPTGQLIEVLNSDLAVILKAVFPAE